MKKEWNDLLNMLNCSVSPYHTIQEVMRQLEETGAKELKAKEVWKTEAGRMYYVNIYGTTLVAFHIHENPDAEDGFRIGIAHTDWPCLRIKPNPDMTAGGYRKLNVEVYGGPILATWLDRPLSIAGRVTLKGDSIFAPEERLIDFKRPVVTIPNVAIHMNREANSGYKWNAQTDMLPILGFVTDKLENENYFLNVLAKELGVEVDHILDYDLYIYNAEQASIIGMDEDMITARRLDNLTSCQACLHGLLNGKRKNGVDVIALFDNEECGSRSKQGANGEMFAHILEKLALSLGWSREQYLAKLFGSFIISADVAHAIHPNHPEKCDVTNKPAMNAGFCIKMESNQRYATDGSAVAVVEELCKKNQIRYAKFANRSDIPGGGTIGSILSSFIPAKTIDVGIPLLAMHSARELMAADSQCQLNALFQAFFTEE